MLKKIKTSELKIGMVVEKMDRPWLKHPFLTNRKKITSPSQIDKLLEFKIEDVYIYIGPEDEGPLVPVAGPGDEAGLESAGEDAFLLPSISTEEVPTLSAPHMVPFEEEVKVARVIQREAQNIIQDVMQDIRKGSTIEPGKVEEVVNKMVDSIFRNRDAFVSLTRIKGYDEYTYVHSLDVCVLALTFGHHLHFEQEELQKIGIGAILHDTGKMKIPTSILNKPGRLTELEFLEVRKHPLYSLDIMEKAGGLPEEAKIIAMQHHERHNGTGYPHGLREEQIHPFSQVTAIIDVYDAVTTNRCYQRAMSAYRAMQILYELGQTQFNLELVERFIQCMGIFPVGTVVELDSAEIGVVTSVNLQALLRPRVLLLYANKRRPYPSPKTVDLMERVADGEGFLRSIIGVLSRQQWDIDVERYLSSADSITA